MDAKTVIKRLESQTFRNLMEELYGKEMLEESIIRYRRLAEKFSEAYDAAQIEIFSSPGRTEISGNHTDHNHGKVLAGSINLDCICAAAINHKDKVNIISETFGQNFSIDLDHLEPSSSKSGTMDLVKGLLQGFKEAGYSIGGFDAYITSNVIASAGVSSSASFEMLLCAIINKFFNEGRITAVRYAHIGKYAENVYWDKASGLLDQMTCAVGGLISIDFIDPEQPEVRQIEFDFASRDHSLMLVQTGKGHADLSADYSSVPYEMKQVADYFGAEVCAEITKKQVIDELAALRAYAGDRAVMRALHFFEENRRVDAEVAALLENRFEDFLKYITASGNSSWKWLQNCSTNKDSREQGILVALALTELFIEEKQRGACRVHGGGFAGVIMAVLPNEVADEYKDYMERALGSGCVCRMMIRPYGAICVSDYMGDGRQ